MAALNLRYCKVLYNETEYEVIIAVSDLDEVNNILQAWALANTDIGVALDLPEALIENTDAKEKNISQADIDSFVYTQAAISSYKDKTISAGLSSSITLPKILVSSEYVVPASTAFLWSLTDFTGTFGEFSIAQGELTLVADSVNYLVIAYNSGSPEYQILSSSATINYSSIIPVAKILYFDSEINVIPYGIAGVGAIEKITKKQDLREQFKIVDNFTFNHSTLYVELSALTVSNGLDTVLCPSLDTETALNDMWLWYKDSSLVWQNTQANTINNTQYQGVGTGLQTLAGGEYVVNQIYRVIDDTNLVLFNVLSGNYATLAAAKESEIVTDLPDQIKDGAVLVGRMIILKDAITPVVQKIQTQQFATVV